jgi:alpha-1,3-glucan synthase
MFLLPVTLLLGLSASLVECLRYTPEYAQWNLNTNQKAEKPLDYSGSWENHKFFASPTNWRFPFYTLFLDRFVNGDPLNDNANETLFEQDITSTQFRHGGDIQGLIDSLDYIQGFGIKGIYIAGSPFINMPWQSDMYSVSVACIRQHIFAY